MWSNIANEMLEDLKTGNSKHLNALIIVDKDNAYRKALRFLVEGYGLGNTNIEDLTNFLEAGAQSADKDVFIYAVQTTQHQAYGMPGVDNAALAALSKYAGPLEDPTYTLQYVFGLVAAGEDKPSLSLARNLVDQGADPKKAIKSALHRAQEEIRAATKKIEQLQAFQQKILKAPKGHS